MGCPGAYCREARKSATGTLAGRGFYRQQLGPECKVWFCMDALAAYSQIKVAKVDRPKKTFMLHYGRYIFRKIVMGNLLSSERLRDQGAGWCVPACGRFIHLWTGLRTVVRESRSSTEEQLKGRNDSGKQQGAGGEQGELWGLHHRQENPVPRPLEGGGGNKVPTAHNTEGA